MKALLRSYRFLSGVCLLALGSLLPHSAQAATYTWNTTSGSWNTAANWNVSPATPAPPPPTGSHTVIINAGGGTVSDNPSYTGDEKWNSLQLDNGTVLNHDRMNANNSGTWQIGDGNAGNGTANWTFGSSGTFRGGTFMINSDATVSATSYNVGHTSTNAPATVTVSGILTTTGNLAFPYEPGTINVNGGTVTIGGNTLMNAVEPGTRTLNFNSGSFTSTDFIVSSWDTGDDIDLNITGDSTSLIQFRRLNVQSNNGGIGTLDFSLVAGQTLTPLSLTDTTTVFGGNAANFTNNFTVSVDGLGVDDTFDDDLVLFRLTESNTFDGLTQLNFSDSLGTSLRSAGDLVTIAAAGGAELEFLLQFSSLRAGNLSGDLEVWLDFQVPPPIPEPSSILLLGFGALGLIRHTRRKNRAKVS